MAVARFGRTGGGRAAALTARAVRFPRFKLKNDDGTDVDDDRPWYRDSHQADGSVAVLSNRREGHPGGHGAAPERDPDPAVSPWEGMSGAAVWVGDRIVGVITKHHRSDELERLARPGWTAWAWLVAATERSYAANRVRALPRVSVLPFTVGP